MALAIVKIRPALARFHPSHAAAIASWIRDERQLHWVSPSTQPPLTPDKVLRWPRPDGEAFVLIPETYGTAWNGASGSRLGNDRQSGDRSLPASSLDDQAERFFPPCQVGDRPWRRGMDGGTPLHVSVRCDGADGIPQAEPLAYSEINHMRSGCGNWWIGHFIVHPEHRGQGLGRALLSGLLSEAFENLEANSVCLVVFPENIPAMRCYESAGFQRIGNEYHRFASHQSRTRLLRYEMTKEAWSKSNR